LKSFINGLTGITAETLKDAPKVEQVLKDFQAFVGDLPIVGYNAAKSDLPILLEHGIDYRDQYKVDLYEEAFERRSSDLHGIANLKLQTVANFLGFHGKSHNSLEDARMTARVYEAFLEGIVLFAILNIFIKKPRPMGSVAGLFLIGYGVFRFIVEYVREPEVENFFGVITRGQALCLPMIIGGALIMAWAYSRKSALIK